MSADAGERWYSLIQSDSDLNLIALSLRTRAGNLRRFQATRGMAGPANRKARQMLRTEADECIVLARRAEKMIHDR